MSASVHVRMHKHMVTQPANQQQTGDNIILWSLVEGALIRLLFICKQRFTIAHIADQMRAHTHSKTHAHKACGLAHLHAPLSVR